MYNDNYYWKLHVGKRMSIDELRHCPVHMFVSEITTKKQIPEEDKSTLEEILSVAVVPWLDPFPEKKRLFLVQRSMECTH